MKTKMKIAIISAATAISTALVGIINYNIGEKEEIVNNQNTASVNVTIDNHFNPELYNDFSNITEESLDELVTESYNIDKLESAFFMEIKVRNKADTAWSNEVDVNVGDQIEFQIEYKNTSDYNQDNVTIFNVLPKNVKYVEGTSKRYDTNHPNGEKINSDDLFSEKGINVGSYEPNTNVFIRFTIEIIDVGLVDGIRTLTNETRYQVGTETGTVSKNYSNRKVYGWGPQRPTYTMEQPAYHAAFNSITNNAAVGDERDFVRVAEKDGKTVYSSDIVIEAGKEYEVFIYYHNNASSTFNDSEHNYAGVARDVRLSSDFPDSMVKGERGSVYACITSTNTDPEAVWDSATITAAEDMTLHYVTGSAKIYNEWDASGSVLSMNLFSQEGTFIGLDELNGIILGCDEFSGLIIYTIRTEAPM